MQQVVLTHELLIHTIIIQVINENIAWLEENADANADKMKAQKKEMEDIVQPIIAIKALPG